MGCATTDKLAASEPAVTVASSKSAKETALCFARLRSKSELVSLDSPMQDGSYMFSQNPYQAYGGNSALAMAIISPAGEGSTIKAWDKTLPKTYLRWARSCAQ